MAIHGPHIIGDCGLRIHGSWGTAKTLIIIHSNVSVNRVVVHHLRLINRALVVLHLRVYGVHNILPCIGLVLMVVVLVCIMMIIRGCYAVCFDRWGI